MPRPRGEDDLQISGDAVVIQVIHLGEAHELYMRRVIGNALHPFEVMLIEYVSAHMPPEIPRGRHHLGQDASKIIMMVCYGQH